MTEDVVWLEKCWVGSSNTRGVCGAEIVAIEKVWVGFTHLVPDKFIAWADD